MSTHTKGPWIVDANTNIMHEGKLVAFPGIAAGFDQVANARLIAAAPELLEALNKLVGAMWGHGATSSDGCFTDDPLERMARAAIAKAEQP